ncbi:unnamed protein product [Brachionus calyciflorus]|uniref:Uncharacterized protein n=1 Tax=Brachionus calyciflorus TaxID=104777 RepID=A0A814EZN7_9BILA|nr:unnamed protein product [Brachionus calyciflorus]
MTNSNLSDDHQETKHNDKDDIESLKEAHESKNQIKKTQDLTTCPLFIRCEGKGNSKSKKGVRHRTIESSPMMKSIGCEIEIEKKLKIKSEELNEMLKKNKDKERKILDLEQDVLLLNNKVVFHGSGIEKNLDEQVELVRTEAKQALNESLFLYLHKKSSIYL